MSNISIASSAQGSGTFNITSPNTDSNRTIVLPDESGTVITDVSDKLGKVVQVVSESITFPGESAVSTSSTFVDTDITTTYTPKLLGSSLYIVTTFYGESTLNTDGSSHIMGTRFSVTSEDVNEISPEYAAYRFFGGNGETKGVYITNVYQTGTIPTTSPVTVTLQFRSENDNRPVRIGGSFTTNATLTLMEIAQ